ncbi:putative frv operon regulatory protein [Scandinavium sp. TWS1a]|uniref:putative frv operon regulatory protein n=1 Tax=Scandinavium tedordense TaxID=2926521 RepID=UPI002165F807|nr:putative frv operon regulatory protein [Scandinavium tedordense]MCS2168838.1 putative frv operon regulatory protein [Scandinavium tedordense]
MLNDRQLSLLEKLEHQPSSLAELAQHAGVSARTISRDIDYLNFTLSGRARVTSQGNAGVQLDILDRKHYFQLLQRHDNDDQLLALLLLNGFTTRLQLADALNLPETLIADKLVKLRQRYEKVFIIAGRPGVGYFIDEPEARQILILANLLKKDPFVSSLTGFNYAAVERLTTGINMIQAWPTIHRDYVVSVVLAVWAMRNLIRSASLADGDHEIALCIENAGFYFNQRSLGMLLSLLDNLQQQATRVDQQVIQQLLDDALIDHPGGVQDPQLIEDLTGHVTRCAASPVWVAESRQSSMNNLKAAWPVAFDMSIRFIGLLRERLGIIVSDSDLIGLYFACALERHQTDRQPVILLAEQNAIATINKLAIERDVPNCRVHVARSLPGLMGLRDEIQPVCIINNSHLELNVNLNNVLNIRNIITPAGIGQIKDFLDTVYIRQNLERLFPVDACFHEENQPNDTWLEICARVSQRLVRQGHLTDEEAWRICQREQEGENLIVNQLAIPHCWSEKETSFRGYFIALSRSVVVNHEPVSHLLIACASASARHELKIFSYLARTLYKHLPGKIAGLKSAEEFVRLLRE